MTVATALGGFMTVKFSQCHPGQYVKDKILNAYGLSVTEAATALGVARPSLSKLLNGRAHLSPEMALRIEKAFGMPVEELMPMQTAYDIALIRSRQEQIQIPPFRTLGAPSKVMNSTTQGPR